MLGLKKLIMQQTSSTDATIHSAPPIIVKSVLVVNAYTVNAIVTARVRAAAAITKNPPYSPNY